MNSDRKKDQLFVEGVKKTLVERGEKLEPEIMVRLSAIRSQAVESNRYRFGGFWQLARIPAAAFATLALFLTIAVLLNRMPTTYSFNAFEDVEILTAEDNPDFYAELDFYTWLAEESDV